ncbi:MAG: hypothetical protein EOM10_12090 [Opitutae bacterium]|nr:hypothetical protein [Opitutae bacterium]
MKFASIYYQGSPQLASAPPACAKMQIFKIGRENAMKFASVYYQGSPQLTIVLPDHRLVGRTP